MSLFSHSWKSSVRSILWGRELGTNIFLGIVLAMLALNFLGLGLALRPILQQEYPAEDPVWLLNGALFMYFFVDLILRLFLQKIPSVEVRSYLLLPIRRTRIIRFVLFRMLLSGFNLVPLFAVIPLSLTLILPESNTISALSWLAAVIATFVLSNVVVLIVDKIGARKTITIPSISLVLLGIGLLGYADIIDMSGMSAGFFGAFVSSPITALLWIAGVVAFFEGSVVMIRQQFTLESLTETRRVGGGSGERWLVDQLQGTGLLGSFVSLELKLFTRNARARASMIVAVFVVLFVPLYYLMMVPRFLEAYAVPDDPPEREELQMQTLPEERMVRLIVRSSDVPPDAWMFITGNQSVLGPWRPSRVPMKRIDDSTWTRSLALIAGTEFRYIFTLGSWKSEAVDADQEPDVHQLTISADTSIVHAAPRWKEPGLDGFETFMILYMALLLVAMPMLVYGQFLFVWESNYFDLLLISPLSTPTYLQAKYILLLVLGGFGLLLGLPMYWIAEELLPIHLYAGIYNLGVNSLLLMFWSTLSKKRMDLTASIFSTQGKGSTNFMTILPTMILPIVIALLAQMIPGIGSGLYVLAGLGMIGLLLSGTFLRLAARAFHAKKHTMREGFRAS